MRTRRGDIFVALVTPSFYRLGFGKKAAAPWVGHFSVRFPAAAWQQSRVSIGSSVNVHSSIQELPAEFAGTHLWDFNLDAGFAQMEPRIAPATRAEQLEATALGSNLLRDRHLRDCRLRRQILSHCLGVAPGQLNFIHDPKGRPRVLSDGITVAGQFAKFSVAASGPAWLLGVSYDGEIGVGLELDAATFDSLQVAQEFFSAEENRWLASLMPVEQRATLLRCLALKRAYANAVGKYLKLDLRQVLTAQMPEGTMDIVSVPPGQPLVTLVQVLVMRVGEGGPRAYGAVVLV